MIAIYKYNKIVNLKVGEYEDLETAKVVMRRESKANHDYIYVAYENNKVVATGIQGVVV